MRRTMTDTDPGDIPPATSPATCGTAASITRAEQALARLDAANGSLSNTAELSDAALCREAVALARSHGGSVALADLLLFRALGQPTVCAATGDRTHEPGVVRASRYLDVLHEGRNRIRAEGSINARILADLLASLVRMSETEPETTTAETESSVRMTIPPAVSCALVGIDAALRSDAARRSPIVAALLAHAALLPLRSTLDECGPLSRIAGLLALCGGGCCARALLAPSAHGDSCFADDVATGASAALMIVHRITALIEADQERVRAFTRAAPSAHRVHLAVQRHPVIALPRLLDETGLRVQAATSALHRLRALGIVREITGRHRHRIYSYDAYVSALDEGLS
jgi:ribosomal protein S25